MLDDNDILQVARIAEEVTHDLLVPHGSYTHLCLVGSLILFAHQGLGVVLATFEPREADPPCS